MWGSSLGVIQGDPRSLGYSSYSDFPDFSMIRVPVVVVGFRV